MGNLKYLLGAAIATLGIISIAAARAEVVTVTAWGGHGHFSPETGANRAEDPSPGGGAVASFTYSGPIASANRGGGHNIDGADANRLPTERVFGVELPEVSTWVMIGLGFAGLGFAAFRSPRKRRADLFS